MSIRTRAGRSSRVGSTSAARAHLGAGAALLAIVLSAHPFRSDIALADAAEAGAVGARAPGIAGAALMPGEPDVSDDLLTSGRPVLVNFFASWCGPCRIEHPVLSVMALDRGVIIIGVSHRDSVEASRAFQAQLGSLYQHVVVDPTGAIGHAWGVPACRRASWSTAAAWLSIAATDPSCRRSSML